MSKPFALIREIDALLPQTQCGLCGHRDGCLPYANSIAQGEAANLCVPGGQPVADAIAHLLQRELLPVADSAWPLNSDLRPQRIKAVIREDECIGCTKCISACPVDAIIGSAKLMHTVITDLCTGCELCIAPCPVDCIDLVEDSAAPPNNEQRQIEQHDLRQRYYAHIERMQQQHKGPVVRAHIDSQLFAEFSQYLSEQNADSIITSISTPKGQNTPNSLDRAQYSIELAKLRSQIKKLDKQLSVRFDAEKQRLLDDLKQQLNQFEQPL